MYLLIRLPKRKMHLSSFNLGIGPNSSQQHDFYHIFLRIQMAQKNAAFLRGGASLISLRP